MNYIEKVRFLAKHAEKKDYEENKYFIDISVEQNHWQVGELELIIKDYDYIPRSYINFVKEFDNLGLAFATFYGSKHIINHGLKPIWNLGLVDFIDIASFHAIFRMREFFPFAKDFESNIFAFNREQKVIYFNTENNEIVANNFEEFVEECLMGKYYHEFEDIENNKYYNFLKSLGWV